MNNKNKLSEGVEGKVPPDQSGVKYENKPYEKLIDRIFVIGFDYGIDAEGYSLKENTKRENKAKAEIHKLLSRQPERLTITEKEEIAKERDKWKELFFRLKELFPGRDKTVR